MRPRPGERRQDHPLYELWLGLRARCYCPADNDYPLYGARGIEVCRRWRDRKTGFERFVADMGPRPPGAVLIRLDTDGDYERANCAWGTRAEQNRRTRWCKLTADTAQEVLGRLEHGERQSSIARRFGITSEMVRAIRVGKAWRELAPYQGPPSAPG